VRQHTTSGRQGDKRPRVVAAAKAPVRPPEVVSIPGGLFRMGSEGGRADEAPSHDVELSPFSLGRIPVTRAEYEPFLAATETSPPPWWFDSDFGNPDQPVVGVTWFEAVAYTEWLSRQCGGRWRLPTEAEWEKAARGTDGRLYPWGNNPPTPLHANYGKKEWNNHEALMPVGTLEAGKSPYGIYDMAGNVWEWVSDWYDDDYYKTSPSQNPTGPSTGESKVLRGSSWGSDPQHLRSALRYLHRSAHRHKDYGFRCAKTS
jgi:formylglycine-generating enzyme required for sulfatase activity